MKATANTIKMDAFGKLKEQLEATPKIWLITGVAGFIGSNLLEALLKLNQRVVGLDSFVTGYQHNLDEVRDGVTPDQWQSFHFIDGDIRDLDTCHQAMKIPSVVADSAQSYENVDYVLHQAALGSVPRSIEDPIRTNAANIGGFLNMLVAARDANVKRFVYAASSSTYGDHPDLPKVEDKIGNPLSPYAVTKLVNELYAGVFAQTYGLSSIGLRYFNIFGKRQDPDGAYAAVIPKWIASMISKEEVFINGDGETSRDFCFVENAVQANLLAATSENPDAENQIYNVAVGERTSLNKLFLTLHQALEGNQVHVGDQKPTFRDFRAGDVLHSLADISKAKERLGYEPQFDIANGIHKAMPWYVAFVFERNSHRMKLGRMP